MRREYLLSELRRAFDEAASKFPSARQVGPSRRLNLSGWKSRLTLVPLPGSLAIVTRQRRGVRDAGNDREPESVADAFLTPT